MPDAKWFRDKYYNDPEWRKRKRERDRKWRIKNYRKLQKQRDEVFGKKCSICDSTIRLCLHRKDGKPHRRNETSLKQAIEKPEDWIRLCGKCHDGIHWVMKYFHLSWEEIVSRLQERSW